MINLVANDAEKVMMTATKFNQFWSAPLTTAVCLVLLSLEIGVGAAFAGFVMLWVGFVALGVIFANIGRLKGEERKESDKRVTKMGELLRGIKILKLYCWEEPMAISIDTIRKREVTNIKKQIMLQACMQITLTSTPSIMALVAFKVYVNGGNTVFTCLVLFELLRWALMNIPQIIISLVDIKVAKARYTKFLTAHEVDRSMHLPDDVGDTDAAVLLQNCDFSWGDAATPVLSGVNLSVKRKSLSVICGRVGSGKSSLISGLLDELRCTASEGDSFGYAIRGKAAYVAQEAFIQNLSVRENILFGALFDQERYDQVVEACSLTSDFALMPSGDAKVSSPRSQCTISCSHDQLLARVLSATMDFMDATPVGRILNCFSRDTSILDTMVMSMIDNLATVSGWCLASVLAVAVICPPFIVPLVPMLALYYRSMLYYRASARDTNRLQSVNTSPLITHFTETITGIVTIRGFGKVPAFLAENIMLTDHCHRPLFAREMVRRWMDLRLELINAGLQCFCCLSIVISSDILELAWVYSTAAGLAMKQVLGTGAVLGFIVMIASMVEQSMNSVERMRYYISQEGVPVESARYSDPGQRSKSRLTWGRNNVKWRLAVSRK